jgi:hypothetical protein
MTGQNDRQGIDCEQSLGRKEGPPTTHQETKYTHFSIDFHQWEFCVVWATHISFLDVLSAVPPFLSHARKSKHAERRGRSQSSKVRISPDNSAFWPDINGPLTGHYFAPCNSFIPNPFTLTSKIVWC